MRHPKQSAEPFRSLLFSLASVDDILFSPEGSGQSMLAEQHTLLLRANGEGLLQVSGETNRMLPNHVFLLAPGTSYTIQKLNQQPLRIYKLTFFIVKTTGPAHTRYTGELFPGCRSVTVYPIARFARLLDELLANREPSDDLAWHWQQIRFLELIGFLYENQLHAAQSQPTTQAIERTIRYLERNYKENIKVAQLAELANIASWQYSAMFQEVTGKKPLDYLNDLRIAKAKEWLVGTAEPLREIARQVGFSDEYYFSRRFRQATGVSPRQYALGKQRKVRVTDWVGHQIEIPDKPQRVIYQGESFGDLLALGVQAVGGGHRFFAGGLYEHVRKEVADVGLPFDLDKVRALKPDLIIFTSDDEIQYKRVATIAPTLTFDSFAQLEQRLPVLGEWLNRKKEAEQWLEAFQAKAEKMWRELRTAIEPGETASVITYDHDGNLYVISNIGLPTTLYHPLGFQPAQKVKELLAAGHFFTKISVESLADYIGDRLFLLLPPPASPAAVKATRELTQSPLWQSLSAVQNGHAYLIDALKWNCSDAFTREKLLDMLPGLFHKTS